MFKVSLTVFHVVLSHLLDIKWHLQYRGELPHTLIKSNLQKQYLNYHVRMAPLLKKIESQIGSGPLVISAVWFPPSERVTATSVAQVDNKKI